jgi:tetrameric-type glycyl-tRNA synthetase beta subunit
LNQVVYLVEHPQAVLGTFSEEHLAVPREVLVTSMKKHQRYFPVYQSDGSLQAKFITISNGTDGHIENVRYGNERVLRARLEDAAFFWKEDQKEPFGQRVESLRRVTFQEKLGSLYDKMERVRGSVGQLVKQQTPSEEQIQLAERAAELCKADLTTLMVFEFPELQGVMGKYYARNSGESEAVAQAVEEHYLPLSAESPLPETTLGAALSVADKLDTIVGYFGIGYAPSGSQDPYSLRRQAIGICRILMEKKLALSLETMIREAVARYGTIVEAKTAVKVKEFFRARLAVMLEERGYAYDLVDAVLSAGFDLISELPARLEALKAFRESEDFERVYPAFNRLLRIIPEGDFPAPQRSLYTETAEINLAMVLKMIRAELTLCAGRRDFKGLLEHLSKLQTNIDLFFDDVLVMDKNEEIRANRLALLKRIADYLLMVGDFTKLVISSA